MTVTLKDDNLKTLSKVRRVLDCFSPNHRSLSLSEICAFAELPKSTTHRLLSSLKTIGLLDQDRERDRYRLGLKLFELGNIVLANMDLHREARQFIESLARLSGHVVHLAVFDGRKAVVIHRTEPNEASGFTPLVESASVHCTGVGKAILAFQPPETVERIAADGLLAFTANTITTTEALLREIAEIRARGWSVDDEEHQPGVRCVGAPIRDQMGRVFAGVSISAPAWRIPKSDIAGLAQIVVHHADGISIRLGYEPADPVPTAHWL